MSFLIDPALLYTHGRSYGQLTRSAPDRKRDAAFGAATMAVFWGVSVPLYLDQRWTRPIWQACRARSGRDWMLNSGVTRLDWQGAGAATHMVAAGTLRHLPVLALAWGTCRPQSCLERFERLGHVGATEPDADVGRLVVDRAR